MPFLRMVTSSVRGSVLDFSDPIPLPNFPRPKSGCFFALFTPFCGKR